MKKSTYTLQEKRNFAGAMRRNPTTAEKTLWWKLSRNQFGYRFVRQFLLRGYIVDFYCARLRMVIEVDGSVHDLEEVGADDEQRERILEEYGFLVLRFSNEDVLDHLTVVLTRLWDECAARRAALKAFASPKVLGKPTKISSRVSRPCESVENSSNPTTVDKVSVDENQRKPATDEDYRAINEAWQKLFIAATVRSTEMTGAELTTAAERAIERNEELNQWLKKRSESAALAVKGMHVTDCITRKA